MTNHARVEMRSGAARVLSALTIGNLDEEFHQLINDRDDDVSSHAIDSAAEQKIVSVVPAIIKRIHNSRIRVHAESALVQMGLDTVPYILSGLSEAAYINKIVLIRSMVSILGNQYDHRFVNLCESNDVSVSSICAKEVCYYARKSTLHPKMHKKIKEFIMHSADVAIAFELLQTAHHHPGIIAELKSRQFLAKKRLLFWVGAYSRPREILNIIPAIMSDDVVESAKSIEYMLTLISDTHIKHKVLEIFSTSDFKISDELRENTDNYYDEWLRQVIRTTEENKGGLKMKMIEKVFALRNVDLFQGLPGEILLAIADDAESVDMASEQVIFRDGDKPDGLYIVVSGTVSIEKNGNQIATIEKSGFFGELALLDNSVRAADAIAKTEGELLFLDSETCERITEDLPDVLRAVIRQVLSYLRKSTAKE